MKRSLTAFTLLLVAIGIFLDFWDSPPAKFMKNNTKVTSTPKASAYMNNTVTTHFSELGNLETLSKSKRTDLFQQQKRYVLTNPDITSYSTEQPSWQLSAEHGVITTKKEDRIVLTKNVYIWQILDKGGLQEFKTSKITFFPKKQFAETDKQVTLTTPRQNMVAVGMHADLNKQKYTLLSNVKGTFNAH